MNRYDYSNNQGTGLALGKSPEEYKRLDQEKRAQLFGGLRAQQDGKIRATMEQAEGDRMKSLEQSPSGRFPYEAMKLSKKREVDAEYEKRMIRLIADSYGDGIIPEEEERQELQTFMLQLSPDDRQRLIKRIQSQKWSEIMRQTHSQPPIDLGRLSLTQQHRLKEQSVDDGAKSLSRSSSGSPGSFPVGGAKYLTTESELQISERQKRKDYASQLKETSSFSGAAEVAIEGSHYSPLRQKAELGKGRGREMDFKTMSAIDFVADKGNHSLSELQSTLSLPLAYRKTIGEMKCYFSDALDSN